LGVTHEFSARRKMNVTFTPSSFGHIGKRNGKAVPVLNQAPCHEDVSCAELSTTPDI